MRKCKWIALLLAFALCGTSPTVDAFGGAGAGSTALTSVTLNTTPTPGDEFILFVGRNLSSTAPSMSGTWSLQDSTTACGANYFGLYHRPVTISDSSATVTVFSSAIAGEAYLYEVNSFGVDTDNIVCSTTINAALNPSATAAGSGELALATFGWKNQKSAIATPSVCSGFTQDSAGSPAGNEFLGAHEAVASAGTVSCSETIGSQTSAANGAAIFLIKPFSCIVGGRMLFGLGC